MDPVVGDLESGGDVLIDDGVIVEVGSGIPAAEAEVIDCAGKIVLPGFVNSHHHMFQTALRNYWSDALDMDYFLQSRTGEDALFHQYAPADVYWGGAGGEPSRTSRPGPPPWSTPRSAPTHRSTRMRRSRHPALGDPGGLQLLAGVRRP